LKTANNLIAFLEQTFKALKEYRWRLNPTKCLFVVPFSILLGYVISAWGIKANLEKVSAITRMQRPTYVKDIQKLKGCMAALSCFISRLGEKGLPFFKLLKANEHFEWTKEADKAFTKLKQFLTLPLIMTTPQSG
jgi:K+-transporting ATPase A subunit